MYAAIRQGKAKPGMAEAIASQIKDGMIPIVSAVAGFRGYYVVYAPDDTVTAVSLFDTYESAQESNRLGIAWARQHLTPMLAEMVEASAGPVIVHTLP